MLAWTANDHKDGLPRSRGHDAAIPLFEYSTIKIERAD
jgi:hypothetical protein